MLLTPGLSVIIDAIKESRKIFQRMNSYAIYRIAETLRVLLFMTLAILVFNFYPVTAVMIVMLALLNDGAILSIAYDNVRYNDQPEAWNMRLVLGIATVLGVVGPIAAFGLFYLGDRVFHLDRPQLQTLMYLMLSVAGHLTIFLTRTRGPFWSIRPARILLDRRARHPGPRDPDRRLRAVHDTPRLGLGRVRLGLRAASGSSSATASSCSPTGSSTRLTETAWTIDRFPPLRTWRERTDATISSRITAGFRCEGSGDEAGGHDACGSVAGGLTADVDPVLVVGSGRSGL